MSLVKKKLCQYVSKSKANLSQSQLFLTVVIFREHHPNLFLDNFMIQYSIRMNHSQLQIQL